MAKVKTINGIEWHYITTWHNEKGCNYCWRLANKEELPPREKHMEQFLGAFREGTFACYFDYYSKNFFALKKDEWDSDKLCQIECYPYAWGYMPILPLVELIG